MSENSLISFNQDGTSVAPKTPAERVKEKLITLLTTHRGDLPNNLNYGTDVHKMTMFPINTAFQDTLTQEVRAAVAEWLSYVNILSVSADKQGNGLLKVSVYYSLGEDISDEIEFVA